MSIRVECEGITKSFDSVKSVFKDINLVINPGDSISVTGPNGSGKSTFLKIMTGIIRPTNGKIKYFAGDKLLNKDEFKQYFGFVAPYLNLYEEFTPVELIKIYSKIRRKDYQRETAIELLKQFKLYDHRLRQVREYSSGMKQRMKFILALLHDPQCLFFDEPSTNLDEEGISQVESVLNRFKEENKMIVIATNDKREKSYCEREFSII
jgi:heme exporter protein A